MRSETAGQSDLFDRLGSAAATAQGQAGAHSTTHAHGDVGTAPTQPRVVPPPPKPAAPASDAQPQAADGAAVETLRSALETLAFQPLPDGVRSPRDALYVLGWHEGVDLEAEGLARRFRSLALIFHPDTGMVPSGPRMAQLVEARNLLSKQIQRRRRLRLADLLAGGA